MTLITKRTGDRCRYSIEDRQIGYDRVTVSYQEKDAATRRMVGKDNGSKAKKFKDKQAATAAAQAEAKPISDQQAKFSISTAYAYPAITTENLVTLQGFKAKINGLKWTVDKAVHSYSKNVGLTTQVDLVAPIK